MRGLSIYLDLVKYLSFALATFTCLTIYCMQNLFKSIQYAEAFSWVCQMEQREFVNHLLGIGPNSSLH